MDSRRLRSGVDGPITIDLSDDEGDTSTMPPRAIAFDSAALEEPSAISAIAYAAPNTNRESSVLSIPDQPTGGHVWSETMIHLKRRAVQDEPSTIVQVAVVPTDSDAPQAPPQDTTPCTQKASPAPSPPAIATEHETAKPIQKTPSQDSDAPAGCFGKLMKLFSSLFS